ncbi:DUF2264 domain-containing protein [Actinomadura graeca]|uniref:DUF2264 domain-containing protein n=1 Tax=Actinomadura graeca TaxID=2750812 RepID=A0ABX8QNG5_9ACTN|nr:DUF2264 domain-containing protein [Actinomadura graeca]QXJ19916.1 DUF2264 domain-containing protein [Actinomadura graeca]
MCAESLRSGVPWPEPDFTLSPYTGYTRAHWTAVADDWLLTAREFASPGHALIALPGRPSWSGLWSDRLEGFARTFLLASCRIAGASGQDPLDLAGWYAEGLAAGSDVAGVEGWPRGVGCRFPPAGLNQPIVEAANLAFALHLSRPWVFDRLDDGARNRLVGWLAHHAGLSTWDNNWSLFPAVIEAFLHSVGADTGGLRGAGRVAEVEEWYAGDGWYFDGRDGNADYYTAWGIQPLLWAWYAMRDPHGAAAARNRERLGATAAAVAAMIAPGGAPVHHGRSLTYRTAVLAPLWLAALEGCGPLRPGETRGIAGGVLRYFRDGGVDQDGPLPPGWRGPSPGTVQEYSGPASPYLAGLGFLGLLLPPGHPVWTATEEGHPAEDGDRVLEGPHWIVSRRRGVVRLVNHGRCRPAYWHPPGTRRDDPHYDKFGYSSHTAPAPHPDSIDGHFGLLDDGGRPTRRGPVLRSLTTGGLAASLHVPEVGGVPLAGVDVTSATLIRGDVELRCHLVRGAAGRAVREGGYCVAHDTPPETGSGGRCAWVSAGEGLGTSSTGLHGWDAAEAVEFPVGNAMGARCAVPVLSGRVDGDLSVHVSAHLLGVAADDGVVVPEVRVDRAGATVTVLWPGGGAPTRVDLAGLRRDLSGEA